MQLLIRRVGALAPVATMLFASFVVAGAGASAQDQQTLSADQTSPMAVVADQTEIRFVSGEVVQDLPPEHPEEPAMAPGDHSSLGALVAATQTSGELSDELHCLAQAVYFEARGEPLAGQLAVARVVINRADSGRFPAGYCAVVRQPAQFSFVRRGQIPAPRESSAAWRRAKAIALIAHHDQWHSEADDALFFHATHVRPSWARTQTARATIDRHVFYR